MFKPFFKLVSYKSKEDLCVKTLQSKLNGEHFIVANISREICVFSLINPKVQHWLHCPLDWTINLTTCDGIQHIEIGLFNVLILLPVHLGNAQNLERLSPRPSAKVINLGFRSNILCAKVLLRNRFLNLRKSPLRYSPFWAIVFLRDSPFCGVFFLRESPFAQ
jgi:hypothetical protein